MAGNAILTLNGTVTFTDNKLNGYEGGDAKGGAIYVFNAILTLNGTVSFTNNEANTSFEVGGTGGAVYLYNSLNPFIYCMRLKSVQQMNASSNSLARICPMVLMSNLFSRTTLLMMYGGAIDNCKLTHGLDSYKSGEMFDMLAHIENENATPLIRFVFATVRVSFQLLP